MLEVAFCMSPCIIEGSRFGSSKRLLLPLLGAEGVAARGPEDCVAVEGL
jgi:hypothetical protein